MNDGNQPLIQGVRPLVVVMLCDTHTETRPSQDSNAQPKISPETDSAQSSPNKRLLRAKRRSCTAIHTARRTVIYLDIEPNSGYRLGMISGFMRNGWFSQPPPRSGDSNCCHVDIRFSEARMTEALQSIVTAHQHRIECLQSLP